MFKRLTCLIKGHQFPLEPTEVRDLGGRNIERIHECLRCEKSISFSGLLFLPTDDCEVTNCFFYEDVKEPAADVPAAEQ